MYKNTDISQDIFFHVPQEEKKLIWGWNDMRMSESWQNVNDPFNNLETEWNQLEYNCLWECKLSLY